MSLPAEVWSLPAAVGQWWVERETSLHRRDIRIHNDQCIVYTRIHPNAVMNHLYCIAGSSGTSMVCKTGLACYHWLFTDVLITYAAH